MTARSKPERTHDHALSHAESVQLGHRAGLAEGFRRGVQAAADLCEQPFPNKHMAFMLDELQRRVKAIRALRPEGEKP